MAHHRSGFTCRELTVVTGVIVTLITLHVLAHHLHRRPASSARSR